MLLTLVGAIVPEAVEITVVAKGCPERVVIAVLIVPVVAGDLVGESVGVIDDDDKVSAKPPGTDCEIRPTEVVGLEAPVGPAAVCDGVIGVSSTEVVELEGPSANTPAAVVEAAAVGVGGAEEAAALPSVGVSVGAIVDGAADVSGAGTDSGVEVDSATGRGLSEADAGAGAGAASEVDSAAGAGVSVAVAGSEVDSGAGAGVSVAGAGAGSDVDSGAGVGVSETGAGSGVDVVSGAGTGVSAGGVESGICVASGVGDGGASVLAGTELVTSMLVTTELVASGAIDAVTKTLDGATLVNGIELATAEGGR